MSDKIGLVFRDRENVIRLITVDGDNIRMSDISGNPEPMDKPDIVQEVYGDLEFNMFEVVKLTTDESEEANMESLYSIDLNDGDDQIDFICDLPKDELVQIAAQIIIEIEKNELQVPPGTLLN